VSFFVLRQSSGRLSPEILLAMFGDEIYQHSLDTPEQKVDLVNAGPNGESIRLQMVSEIYYYARLKNRQREHSCSTPLALLHSEAIP
jgi:hypothetical protein